MPSSLRAIRARIAVPAAIAAVITFHAMPASATEAETEGLALCRLQGLDPARAYRYLGAGPTPEAADYLASHNIRGEAHFQGNYTYNEILVLFAFLSAAGEELSNGRGDRVDDGGIFLFDADIRDRGDGGVYGEALAELSSNPSAFKCELVTAEKVCRSDSAPRAFYRRCEENIVPAAVPELPEVDSSATEGLAFCQFRGRDMRHSFKFWIAGETKAATNYVAAKELKGRTWHYEGGYTLQNFTRIWESHLRPVEYYYPDQAGIAPLYGDAGGMFLYDKDIKDRGDGGVYGVSVAAYAEYPDAYECELVTSEKICQPDADKAFFTRCEG